MHNPSQSRLDAIQGRPWQTALRAFSPIQVAALLTVYLAMWLLMTPYAGLTHDAQVYAFQALARHDPQGLGQDIFLRFQSQDAYSVFPVIYSWFMAALGTETAAATLTFILHWCWFAAAFLVAREIVGTRLALLSLGLLVTIPGPYGGQRVFHLAEPFLTARLPGEVLSLLAIWAFLSKRRIACAALLLVGLFIHPLMTFPAALLCGFLRTEEIRPNRLSVPAGALAVVVVALAGSIILGRNSAIMEPDWVLASHSRSAFLFLDRWLPTDWNHTMLSLLTLTLTALAIPASQVGRVARSALFLGIAGLLLAGIASELWHLKILMQGQPWRWMWLARFIAIVSLPATVFVMWRRGPAGQGAALLLAAAWLAVAPVGTRSTAVTMMATILAIAATALWLTGPRLPDSTQQLARRGGYAVLAVVLAAVAIIASLGLAVGGKDGNQPLAQATIVVLNLITPAVLVVVLAWLVLARSAHNVVPVLVLAAGIAAFAFATPTSAERWIQRTYEGAARDSFADWRDRIPSRTEVFWWNGLRETWFLLDRRSYLTLSQGGGVIFSPEIARELRRRAEVTRDFIDPGYWFNEAAPGVSEPRPLTREILVSTCRDPDLGFVVSTDDIGSNAPRKEWPEPGSYVYLYDCAQFRSS